MKPLQTIRNILVHHKDKQEKLERCEVVYKIPCKSCDSVYVGETGRKLGTRVKEHMKDVDQNTKGSFTRAARKESLTQIHKSAITDHVKQNNHEIDWEEVSVLDRESDWRIRTIKEAIKIRGQRQVMNRDEGGFQLSHVYHPIFSIRSHAD